MKTNLFLTAALSLSLFTASTAQTLPVYLPTDGLVGWWPFNGNANDESGNGNNGTVNGATLANNRFEIMNSSYFFSGEACNTRIDATVDTNPINSSNQYTISLWVKKTGEGCIIHPRILEFYSPDNVGAFQINWDVYGNDLLTVETGNEMGEYQAVSFYSSSWLNSWHNLIVTCDTDSLLLYDNGVFAGGIPFNGQPRLATNGSFGRMNHPAFNTFQGFLDDIAIYNRALSPEEITALYTGEPVNPPTACNPLPSNLQNGLVGYWPFCGNANDESGNGNDGTVNGATLTEDRFGEANAAYDFDGESTFINVGNDLQFSELTYNAWMRPTTFANSNEEGYVIISNLHNIEPYYGNNSELYYSVNGSIVAGLSGGIWEFTNDAFYADTNIWTMVTLTYSENVLKLYKNGSMEFEQPWGDFVLDTVDTYIGARPNNIGVSPWAVFNGSLDDIAIYNRALSPEEVQQLYTLNACTFTIYDTVTVTQTVYDTLTTYTTVTDTLIINTLITELAPPANTNTIKVFPNPAGSTLTIDYGNFALMNGYQLRIENSLGQQVFQTNISQQSDTLNLGTWGGNGLYFVHIVDPQGNTVDIRKIVLQ